MGSTRKIIPSIGGIAGLALCAAVVITPLLAGGATPLGTMVVRLLALGLFLVGLFDRKFAEGLALLFRPLGALGLLAILGLAQALPWPRRLIEVLSPAHVALTDGSALALGDPLASHVALSLYPAASRGVALDFLVFALLGAAAHWVGFRRSRRLWLALAVVGAAGLQVVLGLRPWLGGLVPRLRGTYANPDHLCILLEIGSCIACGGIFWALSTRRFEDQAAFRAIGVLLSGAILMLMLTAISFTGSRAAILAVLVGLAVLAVAASRNRRARTLAVAGAIGLAATGFLAWIGTARAFGRLASTSWFEVASSGRSVVWFESLQLIQSFPFLGTGLGTFEQAFPLVQPAGVEGVRWAKAHNDFLELIVTGGALAALFAAIGAVSLIRILTVRLRSAVRTDDRVALSVALGCLAAVAVHEALDFGLSLPANAFVLTVVVAASIAPRADS